MFSLILMPLATEQEIQASYRDSAVAEWYIANRFESELMRLLHERQVGVVNGVMDAARPERALEIAPGPGRLTRDVRPAGELTCLEYNEAMIAQGRAACPATVKWLQGNAFELPFDAESFDFAYSFRFIRHFHRDDRRRLHQQLRKVLRPGATLVFDAVNRVVSEPLRKASPESYPIYDKLYANPEQIRTELAEDGFEVTACLPVQRRFAAQSRAQILLGPRSRLLARTVIRTLERFGGREPLEWIVTCRRV
jgi:ubiquinone/menaquinone biosynthesis C-methylase UbiE